MAFQADRAERLLAAADGAGWQVLAAAGLARAREIFRRESFQLAVVDLGGSPTQCGEARELVEVLSARPELLLVVCSEEGATREEAWVRQLGTWMYLPGRLDDPGLSMVCREALAIVERLRASGRLPTFGG